MVDTLDQALKKQGQTLKALEVWKETMPTEAEMLPKDKYTMFDRKEKRYRKGIHSKFGLFWRGGGGGFRGWEISLVCCSFVCVCANHDRAIRRAAEVDESFSESKPSWLLDGAVVDFGGRTKKTFAWKCKSGEYLEQWVSIRLCTNVIQEGTKGKQQFPLYIYVYLGMDGMEQEIIFLGEH